MAQAILRIGAQNDRGLWTNVREDLLPEVGDVAIHHGGVDQAGVHHLQDVFILEVFLRGDDFHRLLAGGGEPRIQRHETFVVGARRTHVHAAAGELFDARPGLPRRAP